MTDNDLKKLSKPDTHGATRASMECVCITFPVSGWYKLNGDREIYFLAGDQLVINGPFIIQSPKSGTMRDSK